MLDKSIISNFSLFQRQTEEEKVLSKIFTPLWKQFYQYIVSSATDLCLELEIRLTSRYLSKVESGFRSILPEQIGISRFSQVHGGIYE